MFRFVGNDAQVQLDDTAHVIIFIDEDDDGREVWRCNLCPPESNRRKFWRQTQTLRETFSNHLTSYHRINSDLILT